MTDVVLLLLVFPISAYLTLKLGTFGYLKAKMLFEQKYGAMNGDSKQKEKESCP